MSRATSINALSPPKITAAQWRLAAVIVFGAFASGLDTAVANIGLDRIAGSFGTGLSSAQWIVTSYLVAIAVALPACAWLGRKIGVGRLWLGALAVFTVASALCAAAANLETLVALRIMQGLSAGLLIPAGQTILGQEVGPERLGRVMSTLGLAVVLGPALGPVVGGAILHSFTWPWLFLINVPIGVIGLMLGLRLVPRGEPGQAGSLDWRGLLLIGTGLPLVLYSLTSWGSRGTAAAPAVWIPLALGIGAFGVFIVRSRRVTNPLLDLRLFHNPGYRAASLSSAVIGILMFGSTLLFPLYLQLQLGDDPGTAGLRLLALTGGTAIALPIAGRLTDKYGGGIVAVAGCTGMVVTSLAFVFFGATDSLLLTEILLALMGGTVALGAGPTTIAAYKQVSRDQLPDATAQVNILNRVGGALGGAIFAVIVARTLPAAGAESAFHTAFWWQTAAAAIALVCASWLWRTTAIRR